MLGLYIMDTMLSGEKNVKDTSMIVKDTVFTISYEKSNKLITALYMVTDIIPESEPLRSKLRVLGVDILSDINHLRVIALKDILERCFASVVSVLSMLELTKTMGLISEMNFNILYQEFVNFRDSLGEIRHNFYKADPSVSIEDLLSNGDKDFFGEKNQAQKYDIKDNHNESMRHEPTRIGVQKGANLMQALTNMSIGKEKDTKKVFKNNTKFSKKERRFEIVKVMKKGPKSLKDNGCTISDILGMSDSEALKSCSPKTLQRELVSMVKDDVLRKEGSKRWSRYFLKEGI